VLSVLHNPRYAGAFVYGRTRQRKVIIGAQAQYRKLPRAEWKVFLPDAHPGYLSWDEFEANQAALRSNAAGYGTERWKTPAREGAALLQGLVLCGRCGSRMTVRYVRRHGQLSPDYTCQRRGIQTGGPACQIVPGAGLDQAVAAAVLQAVTPAALDVALEVFEELRAWKAEVDRCRRAAVTRCREEAELAQRQFLLVRPEHRLVADTLERQWNEKLARLAAAEEAYRRTVEADAPALVETDRDRIHALATDLPQVWADPRTPMRERKRMLRLLLEDVTLRKGEQTIQLQLRWKGGATSVLERPRPLGAPDVRRTPPAIIEEIRALATAQTDRQIGATLNGRWRRTGTGQPFTRLRVRTLREAYGIPSLAAHLRQAGWLTAVEIAAPLAVHYTTAKRFAREGVLRAVRADDKGDWLFAPLTGPLPRAHPGKRFRDRRQYPVPQSTPQMREEVQYEA